MATITLFTKTLRDAVGYGSLSDTPDADFDKALPGYIQRLQAAISDGDTLEVNEHDLAVRSLMDDEDGDTASILDQVVEFWA